MSTTATAMLAKAATFVGYKEGPNNTTIFGQWYGLQNQPYCDMGISYVAAAVGAGDVVGKYAFCPSHVNWFKGRGQWDRTPARGALVFYQWSLNGVADHVGIVEAVLANGLIQTIEFNTSSGVGSQSNGDGCYRRIRNQYYVLGYGHPAYSSSSPVAPVAPVAWDGHSFPGAGAFVLGQSHPAVTVLGQHLVMKGFGKHYTQGPGPTFSEADRLNTVDYQHTQGWVGGDADGYPGAETWSRLMFLAAAPAPRPPAPAPAIPSISLEHLLAAAQIDGPAAQGHQSFPQDVRPLEAALARVGLLSSALANDGSAGYSTFGNVGNRGSAYQHWQQRLGYRGRDADGYPGLTSLVLLGKQTGLFTARAK